MKNLNVPFIWKTAVLTLVVFVLYGVDFLHLSLSPLLDQEPWSLLMMALLHATALGFVVRHSIWRGQLLIVTMFVVYFGVTTLLTHMDTVLFLHLLNPVVPGFVADNLLVNGFINAAGIAPAAVWLFAGGPPPEAKLENIRVVMPARQWLLKGVASVGAFMVFYALGALGIAQPLLGPDTPVYTDTVLPLWVTAAFLGKGLLWIVITLPLIRQMRGQVNRVAMGVGGYYGVLQGALLVIPTEYLAPSIRTAHMAGLTVAMFAYGWLLVILFHRAHGSLRDVFSGWKRPL
ncbi:MAG: hypothetical protein OEW12_03760 [Deltaproteobacteria bacterium]|nr:hypothetical protein [Deltaproteobacteria bacterium]